MTANNWAALELTLRVATCSTILMLPPGVALGWILARRNVPGRALIDTITALPMVLPPTAVGYLLLRLLARNGPLGERQLGFDLDLLFTWKGAVVAAAVMSLPLIVRTARLAFEQIDPRLEGLARTLGLGPLQVFLRVTLPGARRGLLAAAVIGFTRALGEFGATIIVAGNIPGQTQTLSLAIFSDIQLGRDREAMLLVAITVAIAFVSLWASERLLRPEAVRS